MSMMSYDSVKRKIYELRKVLQNNHQRMEKLKESRAVDWEDSEEGREYMAIKRINAEIEASINALVWTIDVEGFDPRSERIEQLSGKRSLLHQGGR